MTYALPILWIAYMSYQGIATCVVPEYYGYNMLEASQGLGEPSLIAKNRL